MTHLIASGSRNAIDIPLDANPKKGTRVDRIGSILAKCALGCLFAGFALLVTGISYSSNALGWTGVVLIGGSVAAALGTLVCYAASHVFK